MVKAKFAQEFVISEGDKDEGEKDEQHFWYEATKSQQDWLEKLIEIPTTGTLWKCGWGIDLKDAYTAFLKKGNVKVPIRKLTVDKDLEEDLEAAKLTEGQPRVGPEEATMDIVQVILDKDQEPKYDIEEEVELDELTRWRRTLEVTKKKLIMRQVEKKVPETDQGMFVSPDGYSLGSIDVGDAYLMVEQEEPTVVEVDGKYYVLGFTLAGQTIGSSAWFNKLKGYLEEFGLRSDEGLPALFYRVPEGSEQGIIVLSHVDGMELFASKEDFQKLVEFLKGKGLKIKVEGPMDEKEDGSIVRFKQLKTADCKKRIDNLEIKPVKGKDNPADLGTMYWMMYRYSFGKSEKAKKQAQVDPPKEKKDAAAEKEEEKTAAEKDKEEEPQELEVEAKEKDAAAKEEEEKHAAEKGKDEEPKVFDPDTEDLRSLMCAYDEGLGVDFSQLTDGTLQKRMEEFMSLVRLPPGQWQDGEGIRLEELLGDLSASLEDTRASQREEIRKIQEKLDEEKENLAKAESIVEEIQQGKAMLDATGATAEIA
ncbi:unnamed protein product [Symbiodinium microadriaticum]|nr:unnamed protein product [Symbiodinium microadriaticum]